MKHPIIFHHHILPYSLAEACNNKPCFRGGSKTIRTNSSTQSVDLFRPSKCKHLSLLKHFMKGWQNGIESFPPHCVFRAREGVNDTLNVNKFIRRRSLCVCYYLSGILHVGPRKDVFTSGSLSQIYYLYYSCIKLTSTKR